MGGEMNEGAVIVTGASRGLGAATARALVGFGAPVVLCARTAPDLHALAGDIRDEGGQAEIVAGDVTQSEVQTKLVDVANARFGGIRGLVNNAATLQPIAPLADADGEAWAVLWRLNVLTPVTLTRLALPALRTSGGRVINVSSGAAEKTIPGWAAYDVSKAALNHFTRQLAEEEPDIVAVAVRPGTVNTQMQAEIRTEGQPAMRPQSYAHFVELFEQGRLLPPEKPGRAIAVLALWAPPALTGEFVRWDDARVEELAAQFS
jgi:NAD(P)-dependent dehydrogenase (short-subunit alcohol dehydrogenase family)